MLNYYLIIIASGLFAIIYGSVLAIIITKSPSGNEKMREIALAIHEGAIAYLKRQYIAIAIVGLILAIFLQIFFFVQSIFLLMHLAPLFLKLLYLCSFFISLVFLFCYR